MSKKVCKKAVLCAAVFHLFKILDRRALFDPPDNCGLNRMASFMFLNLHKKVTKHKAGAAFLRHPADLDNCGARA